MSFGQFLRILSARLTLISTMVIVAVAAAVAVTLLLPKRYEATASVIVEPRQADSAVPGTNSTQPSLDRVDNIISTNTDIIASPGVASRVVDILRLERNPRAKELLAGAGPLGIVRDWIAAVQEWIVTLLPRDAERPPMLLKDWMVGRLLHNLRLNTNRDSRLIKVTYLAPDPEFSAAVANAFVQAYRAALLQMQVRPAKQNTRWLDDQVKDLKDKLEQAEARLAKFQQEKGIVATDERMDVENARLVDLSAQVVAAQSLSYESQARQRQLRSFMAGGGGEAPAEVSASPVVQQLKQSVAEREAKLSELSRRIGPNHPQYRAAATELEQLKSQLREQMRTAAQGLLTSGSVAPQREGALRSALEQQRRKVLSLKNARNELGALSRDADNARTAYNAAVQRLAQTKMESEIDQTSGSIVDSATVPTKPASPIMTLNLAIGLALGLLLGVGTALFSETVNRYVRSERDIVEILGMPVLAVLAPKAGGKHNVHYLKGPDSYSLPGK